MMHLGDRATKRPTLGDRLRREERQRIAKHMKTVAENMLRDPTSDAIDGYCAAVILELADTIAKNGNES